jgi:hypothetical protein
MCRDERFACDFQAERHRKATTNARMLSDIQHAISGPKVFARAVALAARPAPPDHLLFTQMWGRLNMAEFNLNTAAATFSLEMWTSTRNLFPSRPRSRLLLGFGASGRRQDRKRERSRYAARSIRMGTLRGQPFQGPWRIVSNLATRRLRRGGSCQLGPAPRRVLRSIQFAKCPGRRSRSAPAAQAARDLRARRVPSLAATRPRLRRLDIPARVPRRNGSPRGAKESSVRPLRQSADQGQDVRLERSREDVPSAAHLRQWLPSRRFLSKRAVDTCAPATLGGMGSFFTSFFGPRPVLRILRGLTCAATCRSSVQ